MKRPKKKKKKEKKTDEDNTISRIIRNKPKNIDEKSEDRVDVSFQGHKEYTKMNKERLNTVTSNSKDMLKQ